MGSYNNSRDYNTMPYDSDLTEELRPVKQSLCVSMRRDTHWKCLILTLLIYGCLAAITWCRLTVVTKKVTSIYDGLSTHISQASPCDDGYIYIPVAFVIMLYLVYLVECWHSHTRIQLQYKVDGNMVYERVRNMREAMPIIWWKAVCYHYVRRTRQVTRYRNGDAFTTTQVYYERVNSHAAGSVFNFSNCGVKDISRILVGLDLYPATKIRFTKGFSFGAFEAECEFEDQRAQFFQENERRDDYMESQEGMDLLNVHFKEYVIAFADPENLPWYVSHVIFWISSMLLLSWPLRVIIEYKTAYVHLHVHKLFGTNYLDNSIGGRGGQMSRVSTMGSSEMEMTIRNNYAMVPSYSEALLIRSPSDGPFQTRYLFRRQMPDANGNKMTPMRSYTFSSLSNVLPARSRSSAYIRGSCSNGYLSGTTRDARPSNCITANQGNNSLVSIAQVTGVEDEAEGGESASPSECEDTDETPSSGTRRHNSRQQRRKRRRKRDRNSVSILPLTVGGGAAAAAAAAVIPSIAPATTLENVAATSSAVDGPSSAIYYRNSSSKTSTPLAHYEPEQLSPNGQYCVIVNSSAVALFNRETTAAASLTTINDDITYANATLIPDTNNSYNRNVIMSPVSPTSSNIFQDQNSTLFTSSTLSAPTPNNGNNGSNNNNNSNHSNNNDVRSSANDSSIVEINPIYSNITDAFAAPNRNPNVPAINNTDIIEISCGNDCRNNSRISQSVQLKSTDRTAQSSSVDLPQQRPLEPENTGAITVVVMDTTQREDSNVELVNAPSLQQQQKQRQQQDQHQEQQQTHQEHSTLRSYLFRKKQSSSSSSSSSGINCGGDIRSMSIPSSSSCGGAGSGNRSSCNVRYGCEVGACASTDIVSDAGLPTPSNPTGQIVDHQPQVEPSKRHLWGKQRRGPSLLGSNRNTTYRTVDECSNVPSSSRSCQSQPPVWVAQNYRDPSQNPGRHSKVNNHSITQSSLSRRHEHVTTSQHDETDPPPCYEDALWMQRFSTTNRFSDSDYRHDSTTQNSASRNERPHRTIQLMETSL